VPETRRDHHRHGRLSRRLALGCACCAAAGAAAGAALAPWRGALAASADHARTTLTPDEALALLKEGNEKFVTDAPFRGVQGRDRRVEIARGQQPFAVLVGCSDSRVPPELLFGRGLGELFIIRVAGNTVDLAGQGSIEYAVAELGVPLVLVLGHERCGAVAAAVSVVEKNATFPGAIGEMVEPIVPAVLRARGQPGDFLDNAVRENVRRVATRLRGGGAILPGLIEKGRVKVVGARYDLDDGAVDFFDEA
jgi:carbonic anhydrase